ncbi:serine/threonine-protein kinase [Sphingomonas immobilis]|uniref:Protein kinase n=1 Tax=Sphingomonas immobilis TaxID=3063997 RepID=A0ABT8ZZT2_9SPHN|nr:serine/threonine-protein kinase [Sphingomonas sp. CA1-15]MDO7842510.1 protein kinase [Sphingomonas sp. CA1-15]
MAMLGRYRIDECLGTGAMAEVYRAHDPEIDRSVAIKVLKPEYATDPEIGARFVREARAAGALSHANIATIYDVGEAGGIAYIAMELVEGQPLDTVLEQQGRMPYERVLAIGQQLASALGYAHRNGVVHRDIKPSNILLCADGRTVKLLDFGVARIGDTKGAMVKTQAGTLIGTPRYMSPEQALGLAVDHRSDLFSLGVVLYEMVTGQVAFSGTSLATLALQIAQEKVAPIDRVTSDCPPGLRFVIDKLLAKKPEARFADGAALERALAQELVAHDDLPRGRRGLSLRIKLPVALALVTATALAGCAAMMLSREQATLEHMAITSGSSITAFVTNNAAVLAADNAGLAADQQDWSALQAFAVTASRDPAIRDLVVVDTGGTIRAAGNPRLVGQRYQKPAGETVMANDVTAAGNTGIRFVRPITYAGARFGTVDLVVRRNALDEAIAGVRASLALLFAVVMAAVLVVGYLSGAMVARPLSRLRRALDDASASAFALRISHRRGDEFGAAFDAFNRLATTVEPQLHGTPAAAVAILETRIADPIKRAA